MVHARAAGERPRDAHLLGELARDHDDPLRADAEERVVLEHRFVLVDPLLDEVDSLADLLVPARRDVVARPADLVETVEEPRARQLLEAVEHHLALADRVQEDGGAAAQRPAHVHHEALVAAVAQLDDLLGLGVGHHFIGEAGAGLRMIARISASSGVALEMNACQSGSFSALARTSARWFRSRYAQRWTTSLSCAISVCHSPTFFEYFSRTGRIALKCSSHSPVLPTWARYVRSSYTCAPSAGGFSGSCAERILFSCATSMGRILGTYSLLHASFFWSSARSRSRSSRLG